MFLTLLYSSSAIHQNVHACDMSTTDITKLAYIIFSVFIFLFYYYFIREGRVTSASLILNPFSFLRTTI